MTPSLSQDPPTSAPDSSPQPHRPKPVFLVPIVLVVAAIGTATWYWWSRPDPNWLELDGRIEGYETDVGSKIAGRVVAVAFREGEAVKKGQLIVEIDDDELQAQLRGITARLEAAKQRVQQAEVRIKVLESQVDEATLSLEQSQGDARGRIYQAESTVAAADANLSQAQANLQQAEAELRLARVDRDRFAQLYQQGVVPKQRLDQAQTALDSAIAAVDARQAAVNAAVKQVSASQGNLEQVQTTALNPNIRTARLAGTLDELDIARSQLVAAKAEVKSTEASRQEVLARVKDLKVASPIDGVVIARSVEPGVVVTAGKVLLTLINPQDIYLRGFVPQGEIGKIKIGQKAEIFLDSAPDTPIPATVAAVDTQASFTPENIYFRSDRVRQVFGLRITIDDPKGLAKPGMPASAKIRLTVGNAAQ